MRVNSEHCEHSDCNHKVQYMRCRSNEENDWVLPVAARAIVHLDATLNHMTLELLSALNSFRHTPYARLGDAVDTPRFQASRVCPCWQPHYHLQRSGGRDGFQRRPPAAVGPAIALPGMQKIHTTSCVVG